MVLGTIIGVVVLIIFCIALLILNHNLSEFEDTWEDSYWKLFCDFAQLSVNYAETLIENKNLKTELEESKDMIKKLSEEMNLKTVKAEPKESETASAEPKKKTTRKTTSKKTTTKKKEVK